MIKRGITAKLTACITAIATLIVMTAAPAVSFATDNKIEKDETVYVITDSAGSQTDIIVSDHLKNNTGATTIKDSTNLSDIENVKGDEEFSQSGNSIKWEANGNDIYYQGTTTQKAPVSMDITYYLDGKKTTGKKIQGKDGQVKIKIRYNNNAEVNGTKVPFIVMSGFIVTDNTLDDITISSGKVIDDGDRKVVVGMAAPGLSSTFGSTVEDLDIGDDITIEGTAKDFDVTDIMTVVTNSIFDDIDTDDFDDLDYDSQIEALDSGAKQLVSGSNALYKGLDTLDSKIPALTDGVSKISDGAATLSSSIKDTFDKLKSGASQLDSGVNALSQGVGYNSDTMGSNLNAGINKIIESLAGMSTSVSNALSGSKQYLDGAKTAADGAANAGSGASSSASSASSAISDAKASNSTAVSKIKDAKEKLDGIDTDGLSDDDKEALEQALSILNDADSSADTTSNKLSIASESASKAKETADSAKDAASKASGAIEKAIEIDSQVSTSVTNGIGTTSDQTSDTLIGGLNTVNAGVSELQNQVFLGLGPGISSLSLGLQQASDPNNTSLVTGAATLASSLETLDGSTGELAAGVDELDSGAKKISDGMSKLYKDGIKKIVDLYNDDLKGTLDDFDKLLDAGQGYKTFTKLPKNMDGSVKFVYKTTLTE